MFFRSLAPLALLALAPAVFQAQQTLPATPATVAWGYYSAHAKPVLTVHSGDTVRVETLSTCGPPERLEKEGVPAAEIPENVRTIYGAKEIDKGPGGTTARSRGCTAGTWTTRS